jgi:hypothetical protein
MSDSSSSLACGLDRLRAGGPQRDEILHSQDRLKRLTRQSLRIFPGVFHGEEATPFTFS